jgi:hypothetical protein
MNKQLLERVGRALQNTDDLVTIANQTAAAISVWLPQIGEMQSHLDAIDRQIKTERNPRIITDLQAQKLKLEQQSAAASKEILLAAVTGIGSSLMQIGDTWYLEDDQILSRQGLAGMDSAEVRRQRDALAHKYQTQARSLMASANILRLQLLEKLPSAQTPQDKTEAGVFASAAAGQPLRAQGVKGAGEYLLADLGRRAGIVP